MAIRLSDEKNILKIHDNLSDTDIILFYRMPTASERISYSNESIQRRKNKIIQNLGQTRQKYGKLILLGFCEGDFEIPDGEGGYKIIASSQSSSNYFPEWKQKIQDHAPHLIELLAAHVFDSPAETQENEDAIDGNTIDEDPEKNLQEI